MDSKVIGAFDYAGFKVLLQSSADESQFTVSVANIGPEGLHIEFIENYSDLRLARQVYETKVENCISRTSLSMVSLSMQR